MYIMSLTIKPYLEAPSVICAYPIAYSIYVFGNLLINSLAFVSERAQIVVICEKAVDQTAAYVSNPVICILNIDSQFIHHNSNEVMAPISATLSTSGLVDSTENSISI
jgi:hypothetical protein